MKLINDKYSFDMKEANDKYKFDLKEANDVLAFKIKEQKVKFDADLKDANDKHVSDLKHQKDLMRQKQNKALYDAQEINDGKMKELKDQIAGLERQVQDLSDSNKEGRSLYDSEQANQQMELLREVLATKGDQLPADMKAAVLSNIQDLTNQMDLRNEEVAGLEAKMRVISDQRTRQRNEIKKLKED